MQTARTTLRRLTLADLSQMIEMESDPEVMKHTRRRTAQAPEQIKERLERMVKMEATHAPLGIWLAEETASQSLVGWFMLIRLDLPHPELGFMLPRRQWNKGYATEVCRALIEHARSLKLPKISAACDEDNLASRQVLKKLGFAQLDKENFELVLQARNTSPFPR